MRDEFYIPLFLVTLVLVLLVAITEVSQAQTLKPLISYKQKVKPVFKNRCAQCHNGTNDLPMILEYGVAYNLRYEIKNKIQTRQMPYFGGMTESERDLILDWVKFGARE